MFGVFFLPVLSFSPRLSVAAAASQLGARLDVPNHLGQRRERLAGHIQHVGRASGPARLLDRAQRPLQLRDLGQIAVRVRVALERQRATDRARAGDRVCQICQICQIYVRYVRYMSECQRWGNERWHERQFLTFRYTDSHYRLHIFDVSLCNGCAYLRLPVSSSGPKN